MDHDSSRLRGHRSTDVTRGCSDTAIDREYAAEDYVSLRASAVGVASSKGRHPLDLILGTQAAVRVLRVLSPGGEHAPPRIARDTKVSRPAVREALIRLEKEGVVERVGDGRNVLYRISSGHPLAKRIVKLFKTEAKRGIVAGLLLLCASSLRAQAVATHTGGNSVYETK